MNIFLSLLLFVIYLHASEVSDTTISYVYQNNVTNDKVLLGPGDVSSSHSSLRNSSSESGGGILPGQCPPNSVPGCGKPYAYKVDIHGQLVINQILTASYTLYNANEIDSTFQWYRHDDIHSLNKEAIVGATSNTYLTTNDDIGKFISFKVLPRNIKETGKVNESELKGPISTILFSEIYIEGNGKEINSGDMVPNLDDHTDFGEVDIATLRPYQSYPFQITNLGNANLSNRVKLIS